MGIIIIQVTCHSLLFFPPPPPPPGPLLPYVTAGDDRRRFRRLTGTLIAQGNSMCQHKETGNKKDPARLCCVLPVQQIGYGYGYGYGCAAPRRSPGNAPHFPFRTPAPFSGPLYLRICPILLCTLGLCLCFVCAFPCW